MGGKLGNTFRSHSLKISTCFWTVLSRKKSFYLIWTRDFLILYCATETHFGLCQASVFGLFAKVVNGFCLTRFYISSVLLCYMTRLVAHNAEALRERCAYWELLWSVFSGIWTEYGEILRISRYSVRMWENTEQNNLEYAHFLCSEDFLFLDSSYNEQLGCNS